jgi:hypothetical protein
MPRLNLVTEDETDGRMIPLEGGEDILGSTDFERRVCLVQFIDHDLAVGADIVDIEFNCVASRLTNSMTGESGIECHA